MRVPHLVTAGIGRIGDVIADGSALGADDDEGIALAGFMLLFYIPMGYYTDLFFYRRRMAKQARERAAER